MDYQVHETAIVDEGAQIGSGSRIWQWVHVCAGAHIGSGVSLDRVFLSAIKWLLVTNVKFKIMSLFMTMSI